MLEKLPVIRARYHRARNNKDNWCIIIIISDRNVFGIKGSDSHTICAVACETFHGRGIAKCPRKEKLTQLECNLMQDGNAETCLEVCLLCYKAVTKYANLSHQEKQRKVKELSRRHVFSTNEAAARDSFIVPEEKSADRLFQEMHFWSSVCWRYVNKWTPEHASLSRNTIEDRARELINYEIW